MSEGKTKNMYCMTCGQRIFGGDTFCQHCGERVPSVERSSPAKPPSVAASSPDPAPRQSRHWRLWLIPVLIAGLGVFILFAYVDRARYDLISVGEYWCTEDHADQAKALAPAVDYTDETEQLEALGNEIESMVVDEYSPDALVDSYNAKVDEYHRWSDSIDQRIIETEGSVKEYDQRINEYHDYLAGHCAPKE